MVSDKEMRGNVFYKSVQILAYADDIDIIGRTRKEPLPIWKGNKENASAYQSRKNNISHLQRKYAQTVLLI
jgi:hypothetical protein